MWVRNLPQAKTIEIVSSWTPSEALFRLKTKFSLRNLPVNRAATIDPGARAHIFLSLGEFHEMEVKLQVVEHRATRLLYPCFVGRVNSNGDGSSIVGTIQDANGYKQVNILAFIIVGCVVCAAVWNANWHWSARLVTTLLTVAFLVERGSKIDGRSDDRALRAALGAVMSSDVSIDDLDSNGKAFKRYPNLSKA